MQKVKSSTSKLAAIYVRVSTPDQAASDRTSLAWQEGACRIEAERHGLSVVDVYSEQLSGAILERPELQRALSDLEAGKFATLIIADLSRYSRERGGQEHIVSRIHAAGGRLISCDVGAIDPSNPESELQRWIRGDIDAYERLRTRARTKRGSLEQAKSGRQPCRRFSPLGYRILTTTDEVRGYALIDGERSIVRPGEAGTYRVVPSEAQLVQEIFKLYNSGMSLNELADAMNQAGYKTRGGKLWSRSTLQVILHSRNYIGEATYGQRQSVRGEGGKRKHIKRSPEEVVIVPIPPIVENSVWDAAQERCAVNTRRSGNPQRRCLLSGLCRCGICGAKIVSRTSRKTHYYTCWPASRGSLTHAYHKGQAEELVISAIAAIATRKDHLAAAIQWAQETARKDESQAQALASLAQAKARVKKLQERQRATVEAQISGISAGVPSAVYQEQLEAVASELSQARQSEEKLLSALSTPIPRVNPGFVAQQMTSAITGIEQLIRSADPAEASQVLSGIIQGITLYRSDTPALERVVVKFAPLAITAELPSPTAELQSPTAELPSTSFEEEEVSMISQSLLPGSNIVERSLAVLTVPRTWPQQTVKTVVSLTVTVIACADGSISFQSEVA